jgi:hypothetical protein
VSTATDVEGFVVTLDWIMAHTDSGLSLTRDQVLAVDDTWPVRAGWKHRWVGRRISDEQRARFEQRLNRAAAKRVPLAVGSLF